MRPSCAAIVLFSVLYAVHAQPMPPWVNETIPGPAHPHMRDLWLASVQRLRSRELASVNYSNTWYTNSTQLSWTASSFVSPQVMIHERQLFNPATSDFTVGVYLDGLQRRYGGIDSVLLWQSYPNMGIDNRNQFDMLRDIPGGLEGVKSVVAAFHARGVKVLFPYNPWDTGTRDEGAPDSVVLPRLLDEIGADGFNGDTMGSIPATFWLNSVAAGRPLALEPEGGGRLTTLNYTKMGWGEAWEFPDIPAVGSWKWLEPLHITHIVERWAWNHTNNIQAAYFNGIGFVSWEHVWGIWQGMTPRDCAQLHAVATIQRFFASAFVSRKWVPHTSEMLTDNVYASKWPFTTPTSQREAFLFTIVHRRLGESTAKLNVSSFSAPAGSRFVWYDCYAGKSLQAQFIDGVLTLTLPIQGMGYGCIVGFVSDTEASGEDKWPGLAAFNLAMQSITSIPLAQLNASMIVLPQKVVPISPAVVTAQPAKTSFIPATPNYTFNASGIMVETDNDRPGVDFQYPWESYPTLHHNHTMAVSAFYIDRFPFTNARFKAFLAGSRYHPQDNHNFLKDWTNTTTPGSNATYLPGWGNKPVTWVSFSDARAACHWAGGRLPHEWEWQYAAQGNTGHQFPWGQVFQPDCVPVQDTGRVLRGPDDVDAHPCGASPFGVLDMVGNVWQWTDEFQDPHTRAASLKGGSYYYPQGSHWYFPETYKVNEHGKYLLMAPSLDRAGTLGFRCVYDVESE